MVSATASYGLVTQRVRLWFLFLSSRDLEYNPHSQHCHSTELGAVQFQIFYLTGKEGNTVSLEKRYTRAG